MSPAAKERLIESVTCTGVFAIVFGLSVSCSDGRSPLSSLTGPSSKSPVARIISRLSPTSTALPQSGTQAPLIAAVFQSTTQPAQIQQSFLGLSCNAFQPGATVDLAGATTGFIPLEVLGDPFILGGVQGGQATCAGVFAQLGGGTNLGQFGGTLTNPGVQIFSDGTLSTLIVTGYSTAGKQIRCTDLTDTAAVHDSDLVQPYFVVDTNSVVLAVGSTQLPLTCQLNIAAGDQAGSISVQWAKI